MAIGDDDIKLAFLLGYSEGTLRRIADICAQPQPTKAAMAANLAAIEAIARATLAKTGTPL